MRSFLPALLLWAACTPATGSDGATVTTPPRDAAAAESAEASNAVSIVATREGVVELGATASRVPFAVRAVRERALSVARDPERSLVLRVEGISITRQPGVVYDVLLGGHHVGVLSFYGVEESNGTAISAFPVDKPAARALERGDTLEVTFRPQALVQDGRELPVTLDGRASFRLLRLVEEKLPE